MPRTTDRRISGLTLLEVLAATMIFAMVMTVLIGTSTTAVHNVGLSARRLEASLLADEFLANLEIQMKRGIAPEVDEEDSTREPYTIRTVRTDLGGDLTTTASGPDRSLDDTEDALDDLRAGIGAMLGGDLPEVAKHLKRYDIEVSWTERNGPQYITRTTFAFDWQTAAVENAELFQHHAGIMNRKNVLGGGSQSGVLGGGIQGGGKNVGNGSRQGAGSQPDQPRYRRGGHNARLRHGPREDLD